MSIDSIPGRLLRRGQDRATAPAYATKTPSGAWVETPFSTYAKQTRQAARALCSLGFQPGDTTAILGFNRPEWVIFDVATMMAGGAPAGIYTTCSPPEVAYIIEHAEAALVLVENTDQYEKVRSEREAGRLVGLKSIVLMEGEVSDDPMAMTWEVFLARAAETDDTVIDARLAGLTEEQTATFIYTSGTTGPPKAVMLTHKNLTWTADAAQGLVALAPGDRSVSYLPLSHIAEQMFTIHGPISVGSAVYFAESIATIAENLKEVQPTILFAVPRIWEKFHAGVSLKLRRATGLKAKIAAWALGVAREVCDHRNAGRAVGGLLGFKYGLAQRLVLRKIKDALGLGQARVCVSGAAPISKEILEFLMGLDLIVHEVYGQSEDSGPTTFNAPGKTRIGSVGQAIPGVTVRLVDDHGEDAVEGEIIVRGPNVFAGYYKDPDATADALKDGWLFSGDIGTFDPEGFLHITGRKKEIIITAGGKNIAPKNIEGALRNHELISQAVVIGDRRKFLSALITLDPEAAARFAKERGITAPIHSHEALKAEIQKATEQVNRLFARVEHIRKFTVLEHDFGPTGDQPELTPTLKVKRRIVADKYADQIEAMYA